MSKEILVLSGGLDSMVMAYQSRESENALSAIYFDFGRPAREVELRSVKYTCNYLEIPLEIVNIQNFKDAFAGLLINSRIEGGDSPDPDPIDIHLRTDRPTGFPIVVEMSFYYATLANLDIVSFGLIKNQFGKNNQVNDYFGFAHKGRSLINHKVSHLPKVGLPLSNMDKSQVVKKGAELKAPFQLSWSCYSETNEHCGVCEGCLERKNAFLSVAINDPTNYKA